MAEPLAPRSGFAGLLAPIGPGAGAGVVVTDRDGLALATVIARPGAAPALAARVRERFGLALPSGPQRAAAGTVAFAGTGPDAWLAAAEGGDGFVPALAAALDGLAAVVDQSGGTAVLRLAGPAVPAALAKGIAVDLHPRAFAVGAVAVTVAAHVGISLWRLPDAAGVPVFEVAVARSYAGSFWHWLSASAAEFGLRVG